MEGNSLVSFFTGMDAIDIFTCLLALVITIGAIVDMTKIYIRIRRRERNGK